MYEQRRRATHLLCSRAQQSFELVDLGENGIELLLCFQEPNERYWNGVVVNNIVCGWHIYILNTQGKVGGCIRGTSIFSFRMGSFTIDQSFSLLWMKHLPV